MEQLFALCGAVGVSGNETELADTISQALQPLCSCVERDAMGNVVGLLDNGKQQTVMLEAHMDEIGLMVQKIEKDGFVRFVPVGGIDPAVLAGCEVYVHTQSGERLFGVIGTRPPHLMSKEEMDKPYKMEDLFVDVGLTYEQACRLIQVGDSISFRRTPIALQGGFFASKSVDNRAGVHVLLTALKRLKGKQLDYNVAALFAVQEEVGCRGAKVGTYGVDPDCAIVVDVTHGISPYVNAEEGFALHGGVAIGVGPNLDRTLTDHAMNLAKEHGIPFCKEVCGGDTGTDAWPVQISKKGVRCLLFSIPLRYMHTSVETACKSDIDATVDLMCALLEGGELPC